MRENLQNIEYHNNYKRYYRAFRMNKNSVVGFYNELVTGIVVVAMTERTFKMMKAYGY